MSVSDDSKYIYCKFSIEVYKYMQRYSKLIGSSVADFVRQAVGEKIMRDGAVDTVSFSQLGGKKND